MNNWKQNMKSIEQTLPASTYEPSNLEIRLTLSLGLTILSPYYRSFAHSLNLQGCERVLDFGSGSGICSRHIAARLQNSGGQLACVDISRGWINVLHKTMRNYNHVSCHLGHITKVDLPDAIFDVVIIHYVLHDIPAAERLLVVNTLVRKLKPGGRFILREPQNEGLTCTELKQLTISAGLSSSRVITRKVFIGSVIDGNFTKKL
jgi:ubiquinone/menaquinone biosynthesis C-methylase UbiE